MTSCTAPYSSLKPLTEVASCCRFHGGVNIFRFAANDIGDRGGSCPYSDGDDCNFERVASLCLRLRGLGIASWTWFTCQELHNNHRLSLNFHDHYVGCSTQRRESFKEIKAKSQEGMMLFAPSSLCRLVPNRIGNRRCSSRFHGGSPRPCKLMAICICLVLIIRRLEKYLCKILSL